MFIVSLNSSLGICFHPLAVAKHCARLTLVSHYCSLNLGIIRLFPWTSISIHGLKLACRLCYPSFQLSLLLKPLCFLGLSPTSQGCSELRFECSPLGTWLQGSVSTVMELCRSLHSWKKSLLPECPLALTLLPHPRKGTSINNNNLHVEGSDSYPIDLNGNAEL